MKSLKQLAQLAYEAYYSDQNVEPNWEQTKAHNRRAWEAAITAVAPYLRGEVDGMTPVVPIPPTKEQVAIAQAKQEQIDNQDGIESRPEFEPDAKGGMVMKDAPKPKRAKKA